MPNTEPVHLLFKTGDGGNWEFLATRDGNVYTVHKGKRKENSAWRILTHLGPIAILPWLKPKGFPEGWGDHCYNACLRHYREVVQGGAPD